MNLLLTQSVMDDIDHGLQIERRMSIENDMTDFYRLKEALDNCVSIEQMLHYLVVETTSRNRPSFVSRIQGRIKKELVNQFHEQATEWVSRRR